MKGKLNKKSNEDKEWPLELVFPCSREDYCDSSKMEKIRKKYAKVMNGIESNNQVRKTDRGRW